VDFSAAIRAAPTIAIITPPRQDTIIITDTIMRAAIVFIPITNLTTMDMVMNMATDTNTNTNTDTDAGSETNADSETWDR
jgi:hypothetical protein